MFKTNQLILMEAFQIPGIFKNNKICRAKELETNLYQITMDTKPIGLIVKEKGGWQLDEQLNEALSAENVQLIGEKIDKRNSLR